MTDTKGRKERSKVVDLLKEKVANSKSIIFTEYHGLSATKVAELRSLLRDKGADASVSKNTLLEIAVEKEGLGLKGPTMAIFSYEDAVEALKILFKFAEDNDDLPAIKSGIVDGNLLGLTDLETLSKLPSRLELIAKVLGSMQAPLSGFVGVLGGVQRNFVYALAEIAKTKEA